jgi:hypothetical protein
MLTGEPAGKQEEAVVTIRRAYAPLKPSPPILLTLPRYLILLSDPEHC